MDIVKKITQTPQGLFFYTNYNDTIYLKNEDDFSPKYKLKFSETKGVPPHSFYHKREHLSNGQIEKEIRNSQYIYSYVFFETKKNIIIGYYCNGENSLFIKNKKTGKQILSSDLKDDFGFSFDNRIPDFFYENYMGYVVYPFLLKKMQENSPNSALHKSVAKTRLQDNPVLVLFEIQDNFFKH